MPTYPSDNLRWVKAARFINILDDANNVLSPTKINVWSANLATVGAAIMTGFAWVGGHAGQVADLWAPIGGWLTQAHTTNHFSKREKNKQEERMAAITAGAGDGR